MALHKQEELKRIKKLAAMYNMVPNLLWTAIFLIPITVFCYSYLHPKITCAILCISVIPTFFPNSFFDRMQLSTKARWYRKIGVRHLNAFAQNGSVLNRVMKKKYPEFKVVSATRASIKKQYFQTYFFEKFHFSLFLFFMMITLYAGFQKKFYWVVILTICNVLYNVYPNLLQQYIRLKLRSALSRKSQSVL